MSDVRLHDDRGGAVKVRSATMADVRPAVALWEVAGGPTRTPPSVGMAERLVRTDPEALIIAEDAGRVVGTVIVGWDGWRCHLYRLAVDPAHRRRGVATALIEAGIARAEATGAARIDAMVNPTNALGTAFWRASNFTLDEVERRWSLVVPPSSATPVPSAGLVVRPGADQRC